MTVQELIARFPEIPEDVRGEAVLSRFAEAFGDLLSVARSPSACATRHDAANHYYLKLIGPLSIYGYGLATREETLAEIEAFVDRHEADPDGFASSLLPAETAAEEERGPGCG